MVTEEDSIVCVACGSARTERLESVSASELADAWAESGNCGANVDQVRDAVLTHLGAEKVEFWLCQNCELEFAQPLRSWTDNYYPAESHSLGFDHQLALEELRLMPPMRILEIGCADGQFLELAAAMGHETVGIDFSKDDVIAAKARGIDAHVGDVADLREFSANGRKFNLIALFQVIEHLQDPKAVFSRILEVAAPGAIVMIGCPSHLRYSRVYNHRQRLERSDFWDYPPQHLLRWTPESLTNFLRQFDFQIERIAFEPLSVVGATAHMTALQGLNTDWYEIKWRRRLASLRWLARLSADRLEKKTTGIRLFVKARLRSGSGAV